MSPAMDAERAAAYARMYVRLTEALLREGVPEEIARQEARHTATAWLMQELDDSKYDGVGPCPLCGREEE